MESNGYTPEQHIVWSDGCAAQFKSSKPWYFVNRYPNMTRVVIHDGRGRKPVV
jgi:hypothetical protein